MPSTLNLAGIFKSDAEALRRAREEALRIHPTDIRAAGNQVEEEVRRYLRRMLPPRYHVTSGHLVDSRNLVSPQLDVIIADNSSIPSLLTTNDGTEYVPVTSVYAIGEVKSTYRHSQDYYQKLYGDLMKVSELDRPLVENTAFGGLGPDTLLEHTLLGNDNKYLNSLYSFLLCIDGGDFEFGKVRAFLSSSDPVYLPNMAVFLDRGVIMYAKAKEENGIAFHKYPIEVAESEYDWCFAEGIESEGGSLEGSHLAMLYGALFEHLASSHMEPPKAYRYTSKLSVFHRSSLMWARETLK